MRRANKRNNRKNYASRFASVLFIALIVNLLFYQLPDTVFGMRIKKVDLLSDIREKKGNDDITILAQQEDMIAETDIENYSNRDENKDETAVGQSYNDVNTAINIPDSTPDIPTPLKPPTPPSKQSETPETQNTATARATATTATAMATATTATAKATTTKATASSEPVTVKKKPEDNKNDANNPANTKIEDFTTGRTGLRRFFAALNNVKNLGRPIRIAFVGDSFIEGDILVADFRAKMQEHFGGRGVGFIPVVSKVAQFRPTVKQSADGWKTFSIISDKNRKYVLSGQLFEPESNNASIRFQTVDMYPGLEEVSSLKFIYTANENTELILKSNKDTSYHELKPTASIMQYEIKGSFTEGVIQFKNSQGLSAIGLALEDNSGVIVDNFSLRGNSGAVMSNLDVESCRGLQAIRPYDLIVLQYGLNVASDSVNDYGWYRNKMVNVIAHVQYCFPGADILMLGVSDRSHKSEGAYSTMPAVLSLLRAQRQTAKETEIAFWSIFAAMGGQNSMVKYVNSNWASKDYTHLRFRGGREIANALYNAIIIEKGMYDGDEKLVER
ncbi:MAG: hypothetical protein LBT42_08740 [Tannerella sp.]|jgi:hypothetical protein|nr:hypothetical protein [Tannerella sp.]